MSNEKSKLNLNHHDVTFYKYVLLIGSPNVGKSLTFNKLTGLTAMVSNYPGTTVDIDEGNFTYEIRLFILQTHQDFTI